MELIPWLVAVYATICIGAYFGNRHFMYFPNPTRVAPVDAGLENVEEIEIAAADGVTLVAWQARAKESHPTILYFHGNGANAAARADKIETILKSGFGILYLNNRGHGGSGGRPTEENNAADAAAAYDHLIRRGIPAEKIVAYGESLGSGQAVRLAADPQPLVRFVASGSPEAPLQGHRRRRSYGHGSLRCAQRLTPSASKAALSNKALTRRPTMRSNSLRMTAFSRHCLSFASWHSCIALK